MTSPSSGPLDPVAFAFLPWAHALIDAGDPRMRMTARLDDIVDLAEDLRPRVRSSVRNLSRSGASEQLRGDRDDGRYMRQHGIDVRMVASSRALREHPLMSSALPYVHVGQVPHALVVIDGRHLLVPGPDFEEVWESHDREVIERALTSFEVVWRASRPVNPPGSAPAFTARMVDLAILLVEGATDGEMARELGISERTVSAELAELGRRLGAHGRARTIAAIHGRSPSTGSRPRDGRT